MLLVLLEKYICNIIMGYVCIWILFVVLKSITSSYSSEGGTFIPLDSRKLFYKLLNSYLKNVNY